MRHPVEAALTIHIRWISSACCPFNFRFDLMTAFGVPPDPIITRFRLEAASSPLVYDAADLIALVPRMSPVGLREICTTLAGFRTTWPVR